MATRIWPQITMCGSLVLGIAVSCAGFSHTPLGPSDLAGTWRAHYEEDQFERCGCLSVVTGVETLVLRADGTYQQVYEDGRRYVYAGPWSAWYLEEVPGGVTLHLEGGRFFPLGVGGAERLASGQLSYHSDDDGRGNPLDLDGSEVILNVVGSARASSGRYLEYPPVCDLDSPVIVTFYLVTPDPTPAAHP
jgi:hypothetical protein